MSLEEESYNAKVKLYRDGTIRVSRFPFDRSRSGEDHSTKKTRFTGIDKKRCNRGQSKQVVFDLIKENDWAVFATTTFDPKVCNSYDIDESFRFHQKWLRLLRQQEIGYISVPELHESGRLHFHTVLTDRCPLINAINPHTGSQIFDRAGRVVYNVANYRFGFSEATLIDDQTCVAGYVSKYLTKQDWLPKGKKSYWCSAGLSRPLVKQEYFTDEVTSKFVSESSFIKGLKSPIGLYFLMEKGGRETNGEVNKIKNLDSIEPIGWVDGPGFDGDLLEG